MKKKIKIYEEKIPSSDPRLNRHICHDERSKNFMFDTSNLEIIDVEHKRLIPVLDQGQVGSCTGNAGIGDINTEPFPLNSHVYTPDEAGAVHLYQDAQVIDGVKPYPANDNGSSGLSIAKALKNAGVISSYQHTFTLNDALKALGQYPIITGVNWYSDMYNPDADGRVHITGVLKGGHEIQAFKIDTKLGRIWFYNSWGNNWGVKGTFYLTWADYATLLSRGGDVTVLFPVTITPPTPVTLTPTITITRDISDTKETIGNAIAVKGSNTFSCKTLELPDLNNKPNVSCIPKGTYDAVWSYFTAQKCYAYQLQKVSGRSGIFIHIGNYYKDTKGCILLGLTAKDINKDGEIDVVSSTLALNAFNALMNKQPIKVIIK